MEMLLEALVRHLIEVVRLMILRWDLIRLKYSEMMLICTRLWIVTLLPSKKLPSVCRYFNDLYVFDLDQYKVLYTDVCVTYPSSRILARPVPLLNFRFVKTSLVIVFIVVARDKA